MKRLLVPAVLLLVAATSASVAWNAGRAAPPPPVIAVVDLSKVIVSLNERIARSNELETKKADLQKNIDAMGPRIQAENEAYKILPDGPEK